MEKKLEDTIELDNGLRLEIYDRSRPVAGDRWLVFFVARVEVPVEPEYLKEQVNTAVSFDEIRNAVGGHATYVHNKQSHFVDQKEKDNTFKKLKDTFLETNLGYLSSPGFPEKLILRAYREAQGPPMGCNPQ
jgi:hypothetical protein